ncbi:MAG: FHA domain-containing protein [Candidatus Korarchaeum sp.]|jgi:pSer/pThr/pTyr-binding forkhead associated (FHA) protein|nr:FHA domain-containing protein [Candidatus Korarchaeum sp.]
MSELTQGLRKLRLSMIPMLLSGISLALAHSPQVLPNEYSIPVLIASAFLCIVSLASFTMGISRICESLGEIFCKLRRLFKYLTPALLIFTSISIFYGIGGPIGIEGLVSKPPLLIAALFFIILLLLMAYSFIKLSSLLGSRSMMLGPLMIIPSPFAAITGYDTGVIIGSALGIIGSLIIMLSLTRLMRAEIEVLEAEEAPQEYEEPEEVSRLEEIPERPLEAPRREPVEAPRREEVYERARVKAEEKRARLLGPNGLTIDLELGVRVFGRRDFVGYVPEEDLDYISRRHFEIKGTKEGYFIRDLGSLNGTWVNGNKIGREFVKLVNGAVIDVAEVARLRFSYESEDLGVPEI